MARARPTSPKASTNGRPLDECPPQMRPPRKRPLLLALATTLLVAWLIFMIAMAWRG